MREPLLLLVAAVTLLQAQQQQPRRVLRRDGPNIIQTNGQTIGQQPIQPEYTGPKGAISGTILDGATNTPIKKAQVRLSNAGPQTVVVTDASGSFTFDQLPPGNYVVFANHPLYPPSAARTQVPQQVNLGPGEQKRGIDVKLTPGATVGGRIVDDEGDPIANCNVSLFVPNANRTFQQMHMGNTNVAGEFTIAGIPSAKYYLQAKCSTPYLQPRAFAPPDAVPAGAQFGYTPLYYPGTPTFTGAQKIKLAPGQDARGIDFRMTLQKVTTVSVHVTGLDEDRRTRLFASLAPTENPIPNGVNSLAAMVQPRSGLAQIRSVPAGTYTLTVTSNGPERGVFARETVQVGEEPREVSMQIAPAQPISGVVHMELSPTATGASFASSQPGGGGNRLLLNPVDDMGTQHNAPIAADGTFAFASVPAGRYRANTGNGFVQSVTVGTELTEGPEFELKQGAVGPLTINVGFTMGTVSGDIQMNDSHPTQVLLFAWSGSASPTKIVPVTPGAAGQPQHYSFQLPPGSYRLYALELASPFIGNQLMSSEALKGRDESVVVKPSAEITRNLKLVTAAEFEKADQ